MLSANPSLSMEGLISKDFKSAVLMEKSNIRIFIPSSSASNF